MKQVLVIGAGQSAPYLIHHLLERAKDQNWFITVGDVDLDLARRRVGNHPCGDAIRFDINDSELRGSQIEKADIVINMLGPMFQDLVAWDCVQHGRHMVSVSYQDQTVRDLEMDAHRKGVLLLCELGLDPGIDHMSAMELIDRIKSEGGKIREFCSYGSGIPAPGQQTNPMRYVVTWNPRNVVMAGEAGAQYMEERKIKIVPFHHLFYHTWPVEVEGVGQLEAYPNRDSLKYLDAFGLEDVETMIRGSLRYPGWSETWAQIVKLGLPNEEMLIPDLEDRTYQEVVEMFLPMNVSGVGVDQRVANFLGISRTGRIMENLTWLGLFSDEPTRCKGDTSAEMLIDLLKQKMPLGPSTHDLVILMHELVVSYPGQDRPDEKITSTMLAEGTPGEFTAMAKTVGLPTAIATELILRDEISLTGAQIPTHRSIYEPVLEELRKHDLTFSERVEQVDASESRSRFSIAAD